MEELNYVLSGFWNDFWWLIIFLMFCCMVYYLWLYNRYDWMIIAIPVFIGIVAWSGATGWFSSFDEVERRGANIYSQEQYKQQVNDWIKLVDNSNGKWVSMVSCPASDNGTKYLWAEFAYRPGKQWYEPLGTNLYK